MDTINHLDSCSDHQLLARWLTRDEAAFTLLVERHRGLVYGAARALVSDDAADDVTQAVLVLLARKAGIIAKRERPVADWLLATCRRVAANHRRAEKRRQRREHIAAIDSATVFAAPELPTDQLLEAIDALPQRLREAVVLHHLEGLPRPTVAEHLGVSTAALEKRLQRACTALRDNLARRGLAVSATVLVGGLTTIAQAQCAPPALALVSAALQPTPAVAALAATGSLTMTAILLPIAATIILATSVAAAVPDQTSPAPAPVADTVPIADPAENLAPIAAPLSDPRDNAALVYYQYMIIDQDQFGKWPDSVYDLTTKNPSDQELAILQTDAGIADRIDLLLTTLQRGASMRQAFWLRDTSLGLDVRLPGVKHGVNSFRDWARVATLEAERLCRANDYASASKILINVIALGRHIQRDQYVISRLVGIAVESIAQKAILKHYQQWPEAIQRASADALTALPPSPPLSHAMIGERASVTWLRKSWLAAATPEQQTELLNRLLEGRPIPEKMRDASQITLINRTFDERMQNLNTLYDRLALILNQPLSHAIEETKQIRKEFFSENRELFMGLLTPPVEMATLAQEKCAATSTVIEDQLRHPRAASDATVERVFGGRNPFRATISHNAIHIDWIDCNENFTLKLADENTPQAATSGVNNF